MYVLHPGTRVKWQDQNLMLEREDLGLSSLLADLSALQLIQEFSKPVLLADIENKFKHVDGAIQFINYLIEKKFLVTDAESKAAFIPHDIRTIDDGTFERISVQCTPYTMSNVYLQYSLFQAMRYIVSANIQGDIVECGVWKGGSAMICALTLLDMGVSDRKIYLYDSYNYTWPGFSPHDAQIYGRSNSQTGAFVEKQRQRVALEKEGKKETLLSLDEVRYNLRATGYPEENIIYVEGYVEDTIPSTIPEKVALLRLDTDLYDSTLHGLRHIYPLLSRGGVLLIDDYPTEEGATKATDEYFSDSGESILLNRIGIQGRIGVR